MLQANVHTRVTSKGDEVLQLIDGHNHPVGGAEAQVERVKLVQAKERTREGYPNSQH